MGLAVARFSQESGFTFMELQVDVPIKAENLDVGFDRVLDAAKLRFRHV